MKILLVEPPISPFDVPTGTFGLPPPHHLERLAGALLPHHDVRILDMRIEAGLDRELTELQPDFVGCSSVAANSHLAKQVLARAKQLDPSVKTIMGGHHASLFPQGCNDPYVDYVVIGEGEQTLRELVERCGEQNLPATSVPGIAYRDPGGELAVNPTRPLLDLDNLPLPARHLTRRYREQRRYFRASWRPTDSIISSRGCPFKCTFCGLWMINQGRYRWRDPESIADELEQISDPYVCFVDDNTIDHAKKASHLADLIRARGIDKTYELYGRADTVVRHPDLIEKWAAIGMKLLLIGLESPDQESLESFNKKTSARINRKAIEICHSMGVEVVAYLIVRPSFTRADFRRLAEYVEHNQLSHPVFTILTPFPGTQLYDQVKHTLITDRLDLVDFFHTVLPTTLPLEQFYDEFRQLYEGAYGRNRSLTPMTAKGALQAKAAMEPVRLLKQKMSQLARHHEIAPPAIEWLESGRPRNAVAFPADGGAKPSLSLGGLTQARG